MRTLLFLLLINYTMHPAARQRGRKVPKIFGAAYYIVHEHHVNNGVPWQCLKLGPQWGTHLKRAQCPFKEHRASDYAKEDQIITFHAANNQILKTTTVENNQPVTIQNPLQQLNETIRLVANRAKIVRHHKCRELKIFDADKFEIGHIMDYKGESLLSNEDKKQCPHIDFKYVDKATDYTTPWYDGSEDEEEEKKADF